MIDSVFKTGKNYYSQVLLEDLKYIVKEKKLPEYITDETEISFDDSDRADSDKESSNENVETLTQLTCLLFF